MNAQNLSAARKAELAEFRRIDNECARLYGIANVTRAEMNQVAKFIADKAKYANKPYNQNERYQAEAAAYIAKQEAILGDLRVKYNDELETAREYNDTNYKGWSRFFHVVHLHKDMHCSSFRPTTRIGWVPDVSGFTEAEAVAAHGESLCTICFPSAPVALTQKQADPDTCEGSGKGYSKTHKTGREHSYYGKSGYCSVCDTRQVVTASGNIRKHKKA